MSYQKTSGDGVPTGLPSKITDFIPETKGLYMIKECPNTQPISLEQNMLSPGCPL